jgi:hypothetical protein
MSIFVEHSSPPARQVFLTETLFRLSIFYCAATMVFGLSSWFQAPWTGVYDTHLPILLAEDGALFMLLSAWFGALATFFRQRPCGETVPAGYSQCFLFLQFLIFGVALWPLG